MTSDFVVRTSYYQAGPTWTRSTEAGAIYFRIDHELDTWAEATVEIVDDGSRWQAYQPAGKAYLAAGELDIQQPSGTVIFVGRITSIKQDEHTGIITIEAKDWLHQLDDDKIDYDMREDLDINGSSGVRESVAHTDPNNATYVGPVYTSGVPKYYLYDNNAAADEDNWVWDATNGGAGSFDAFKLMFLAGMAGSVTVKTGPYEETTSTTGALETDTYTSNRSDIWEDDSNRHTMTDTTSEVDWDVVYDFRVFATEGSLYDSGPTAMRVDLGYEILYCGVSYGEIWIYDHNGAGTWVQIGTIGPGPKGRRRETFNVPYYYVARGYAIDTDGVCHVKIQMKLPATRDTSLRVYFIAVETDVVMKGTSTVFDIISTGSNFIEVDSDLSINALGIYEGCPYAVVDSIANHINTIVTDNDATITLTTSVEATTNYSSRKFEGTSAYRILQQLADADGAVFWIPLGTKEVNWKATFTDAAPTAWTDATVMAWTDSVYNIDDLWNNFEVYGIRLGDRQIYETSTDTVMVTKYRATRTKVVKGTGIMSDSEAKEYAVSLIDKYTEPVYPNLYCTVDGLYTTVKLGEEIRLTSTYHNLTNEDYTIVRWSYDSKNDITQIELANSDYNVTQPKRSPRAVRDLTSGVDRIRSEASDPVAPATYKGT